MRKKDMRPGLIYAVKAVDRAVRPGLLVDRSLWDLVPSKEGRVLQPAPADALWSTRLNAEAGNAGGRRGVLMVMPPVGAAVTEDLLKELEGIEQMASLLEGDGLDRSVERLHAVEALVPQPLLLDVVRDASVLTLWAAEQKCPACGKPIALNGSGAMRAHDRPDGAYCPRSGTRITEEEREAAASKRGARRPKKNNT
ncbi:hypothetical protein [Streptomyces albidoflavus]|uniref:hypothetical protein n=1 Tax=Streptomyces albidoflavus TaxID=1886 RepID=UPI0033E45E2E